MIKKLGRIVMFAVAAAFIVYSAFRIKDCVALIGANGWNIILDFFKTGNPEGLNTFADLGWGVLYILVGISALVVALKGHAGFWTFLASALMLGFFIFNIVSFAKNGGDWKDYIVNLSLDIICQLVYVLGIVLVMIGNHNENNELKRLRRYKKNHPDY